MTAARDLLVLPAPSTNRVYADAAPELVRAELMIMIPGIDPDSVVVQRVGGVDHVRFTGEADPVALGRLSSILTAYEWVGDLLRPLEPQRGRRFDEDLITIPKYRGKTNEQFSQLLVNLALQAYGEPPADRPLEILDPLCGRGTTLSCGWLRGASGFGVELDPAALEAHAAFLRTWLRRKRLKHTVEVSPVRREGRNLGKRLDVTVRPAAGGAELECSIFSGDTLQSAALWGKRRFDAVITDAPYGVVHGSHTAAKGGKRERSAAPLLAEAVPVWAAQLRPGGVMAIAWNTLNLAREDLVSIMVEHGLSPLDEGPWRLLAHRVDSSIRRDILIATKN